MENTAIKGKVVVGTEGRFTYCSGLRVRAKVVDVQDHGIEMVFTDTNGILTEGSYMWLSFDCTQESFEADLPVKEYTPKYKINTKGYIKFQGKRWIKAQVIAEDSRNLTVITLECTGLCNQGEEILVAHESTLGDRFQSEKQFNKFNTTIRVFKDASPKTGKLIDFKIWEIEYKGSYYCLEESYSHDWDIDRGDSYTKHIKMRGNYYADTITEAKFSLKNDVERGRL